MRFYRKFIPLLVLICFTTAFAQEATCSAIVQQAVNTVATNCAPTGRNQACYGFVAMDATPREGVQNFTFSKEGDLANVADLDTLRLHALDPATNTWGIALMKLQANLPDALPGTNVAVVMFGDVQLQNAAASAQQATLSVTARSAINVRSGPSTAYAVIGSIGAGETATADGRSADGTWLRVRLPDSSAEGWVSADVVTPAGDVSQLTQADQTSAPSPYTPMQAFYFSSGIGNQNCTAAPPDGILIQTPQGVSKINVRANDVDIQLGSTAFMQAQPGGSLLIYILEGEGHITADGKVSVVPAGSEVEIPIDDHLHVAGRADDVKPYDPALLQFLPIQLLPILIAIAPPATVDQIRAANLPSIVPNVGGGNLFGDVSSLANMTLDQFCPQLNLALAQTGYSKAGYADLLRNAENNAIGTTKDQLIKLEQMVSECP